MNVRRSLDAIHLKNILLREIKNTGEILDYRSRGREIIISLLCRGFPSVEIQISDRAIEALAEQIRVVTAIDLCADPEAFTRMLAQIALIGYRGGPKVIASSAYAREIMPLTDNICTEFAVACAVAFARSHEYDIDRSRISPAETTIALVMIDDGMLARIFGEALIAPGAAGPGRYAKPAEPESDAGREAGRLTRPAADRAAGAGRRLLASGYWRLLTIAQLEGWGPRQILAVIDLLLGPRRTTPQATELMRSLNAWLADVRPIPGLVPKNASRQLLAPSYWNLRSIARVERWSPDEILRLIDEHLNPTLDPTTLDPNFVRYSDNGSGRDWKLLYDWMFRPYGDTLWRPEAGSSHGSYEPCSAALPNRPSTCSSWPATWAPRRYAAPISRPAAPISVSGSRSSS